MRRHPDITSNVRNLLLDPDFLESVFGAPMEQPKTASRQSVFTMKDTNCPNIHYSDYSEEEIRRAKYVLMHLNEDWGLFSNGDVEELRNRIISGSKW